MKHKLFYILLLPFLVGCNSQQAETERDSSLIAMDDYGVCYNPEVLKQNNVFRYHYFTLETDYNLLTDKEPGEPYQLDTKLESAYFDYTKPYSFDFYIRFDPSKVQEEDFNQYIPVLSYYYRVGGHDIEETLSYQTLPTAEEADFSFWRLDFPTKDQYYYGYNYHTSITLDFLSRKEFSRENKLQLAFGIRRYNPAKQEFEILSREKGDNGGGWSSEYWSNFYCLSVTYPEMQNTMASIKNQWYFESLC